MADVVAETSEGIEVVESAAMEDMDLVSDEAVQGPDVCEENQSNGVEKSEANGNKPAVNGDSKRPREDGDEAVEEDGISKKQKVDKSVEEERLEKLEESEAERGGGGEEQEEKKSVPVSIGPKEFSSSEEMFNYFYKFLHHWPPNLNVNKYEYMALLDLLNKGHPEPDTKIGAGIHAFQVRYHPMWKSRCFFLVRHDESVDDFSFRKCVDHILPLPESMKVKSEVNKVLGTSRGGGGGRGGRGGGGRRGGHGRGRGGSRK